MIPVDFAIPADAFVTYHDNLSDQVLWLLHAQADIPGIDYTDDFEIPVFKTSSSQEQSSGYAPSGAFGSAANTASESEAAVAAPPNPKVVISSQAGGTEFYFPAFRTPSRAIFLVFFTVIWTAVVYFIFN